MLQDEFEARIGYAIPLDVYRRIDTIYSKSGFGKDNFAYIAWMEDLVFRVRQDIANNRETTIKITCKNPYRKNRYRILDRRHYRITA